jgi:hypothetical protein
MITIKVMGFIPESLFDAVSLAIPVIFAFYYMNSYLNSLNFMDDLERPEVGRPWWRSKLKNYKSTRTKHFWNILFWSILTSWNIVYAQSVAIQNISGWVDLSEVFSSTDIMVGLIFILMAPATLRLYGGPKLNTLSKIFGMFALLIVIFCLFIIILVAGFYYELKLIGFFL